MGRALRLPAPSDRTSHGGDLLVGTVTLAAALACKRAYASAGADALGWVLAPSCLLANQLGGLSLVREQGAGFITHDPPMVVGPACAGVNFFVIAWLALYLSVRGRFGGMSAKLAASAVCAAVAYVATVLTNGARITLAASLVRMPVEVLGLTAAGAHRLLGVVLYVGVLLLLCRSAETFVKARAGGGSRLRGLVPFACYVGVAVLLPALHHGFGREPRRFVEHATVTVGVGALVLLVFHRVDELRSRRDGSA